MKNYNNGKTPISPQLLDDGSIDTLMLHCPSAHQLLIFVHVLGMRYVALGSPVFTHTHAQSCG